MLADRKRRQREIVGGHPLQPYLYSRFEFVDASIDLRRAHHFPPPPGLLQRAGRLSVLADLALHFLAQHRVGDFVRDARAAVRPPLRLGRQRRLVTVLGPRLALSAADSV